MTVRAKAYILDSGGNTVSSASKDNTFYLPNADCSYPQIVVPITVYCPGSYIGYMDCALVGDVNTANGYNYNGGAPNFANITITGSVCVATPTVTPTQPLTVQGGAPSDGVALGPNPVTRGQDLCVSVDKPTGTMQVTVYNSAGDRVSSADIADGASPCLKTGNFAPGLYWLKLEVTSNGAAKTVWKKAAVR